MYKIVNLFFLSIIFLFFLNIYKYYFSDENIKIINLNRSNVEETLKSKFINIPILENDTNNIIEFNSSFSEEIKDNKPRSFWNLLKSE